MTQEQTSMPVWAESQHGDTRPHEGAWWHEVKEALQAQNRRCPQHHYLFTQ